MTSEAELIQRAQQLDRQALGEIYDRYSNALYRYAVRLLGVPDIAEECVAEVFSRFLHALHQGKGPRDHLQAYLYRIAHNWITDCWRRSPPPMVELSDVLPADDKDLMSMVGDPVEREHVRRALMTLTPDQRQVIVLKFVEDWANEEIAVALDKPVGAVKSLQHRALESLRRAMGEYVYESK